MSITINSGISSTIQTNLTNAQKNIARAAQRLSSGYRINSAADGAADLMLATTLESNVRSYAQAERNGQQVSDLYQTIDSSLEDISNILTQLREVAVQVSNGTLSASELTAAGTTFSSLLTQSNNIATYTAFNGINPLNAATTMTIMVGVSASEAFTQSLSSFTATTSSLSINTLGAASVASASAALASIDAAISSVTAMRGYAGAIVNRMSSAIDVAQNAQESLSNALANTRNANTAAESATLSQNQIIAQYASAMLSQISSLQTQTMTYLLRGM